MNNLLKFTTVAVMVVVVANAQLGPSTTFEAFKEHYGKTYNSEEHEDMANYWFERNSDLVATHNARFDEGLEIYSMKINEFTDQDPAEFHKGRHGAVLDPTIPTVGGHYGINNHTATDGVSIDTTAPLPDTFDWASQGKVSPVKNQGQCGSCWAFSAMGTIESQMLMAGDELIPLSEEQLVDCFSRSCQGDDQRNAWLWLAKSSDGADSSETYPYTAGGKGEVGVCSATAQVVLQITGFNQLTMPTDDYTLKRYLVQNGPLSIDVDAHEWSQNYGKGVLSCEAPLQLDHAVILTGWGTDDQGNDYWIIKNSWSTEWGQAGFGWIAMGQDVDCGITQWVAAVPTLKTLDDIIICELDPNPMNWFTQIVFILVGSVGALAAASLIITRKGRQPPSPGYKKLSHYFAPSSLKSAESVLPVILVHGEPSNMPMSEGKQ